MPNYELSLRCQHPACLTCPQTRALADIIFKEFKGGQVAEADINQIGDSGLFVVQRTNIGENLVESKCVGSRVCIPCQGVTPPTVAQELDMEPDIREYI